MTTTGTTTGPFENISRSIRYDKSNRQISFPQNEGNTIPIREFLNYLRTQGVDTSDVLSVFSSTSGGSRENREESGSTGGSGGSGSRRT